MKHHIFAARNLTNDNDLCRDMIELSVRNWDFLRNAYENYFSIREETITETTLLELALRQPQIVQVHKMTASEESVCGADWMWLILGNTGEYLLFYVQAKRLYPNELYYGISQQQTANIIRTRNFYTNLGTDCHALYVFYNYTRFDFNPPPTCNAAGNKKHYGMSFIHADLMPQISQGRTVIDLDEINPYHHPLACLFCTDPDIAHSGDMAKDVAARLNNFYGDEKFITSRLPDTIDLSKLSNRNGKIFATEFLPYFEDGHSPANLLVFKQNGFDKFH